MQQWQVAGVVWGKLLPLHDRAAIPVDAVRAMVQAAGWDGDWAGLFDRLDHWSRVWRICKRLPGWEHDAEIYRQREGSQK
jgi:hypothetical protein